jgi:hypothetical protein
MKRIRSQASRELVMRIATTRRRMSAAVAKNVMVGQRGTGTCLAVHLS